MSGKTASSQAAWALLTEGVTKARLDAHRIRHLVNRAMALIEVSPVKDQIYQTGGDIIDGIPARLDALDQSLDRTSFALSKMGVDFLESRLPLADKNLVEDAVEAAFGGMPKVRHALVDRYLRACLRRQIENA